MDIKKYVFSIIASVIISAMVTGLLDEKKTTGKIVKLLCGIFIAITIISPLIDFGIPQIHTYFSGISADAEKYKQDGEIAASTYAAGIIKSQTEAYILDKAESMGVMIAVEVELDDSNNSVPCGIRIAGTLSPYAKELLSEFLYTELGIPRENQKWT